MGASLAKAVVQAKTGAQILLANRSQAKVDAFIANFGGQASSNDENLRRSRCDFSRC